MESNLIFLIVGMAGLWFGSGIVVDNGQKIAISLHISSRIIGLTIASIGSSLGELVTNIVAGYRRSAGEDTSGIAFGTIIGSNISLITFVLGFCGLFTVYYLERKKKSMKRDWTMLLVAILLVFIFAFDGTIGVLEGSLLIIVYIFYILVLFKQEKVYEKVAEGGNNRDKSKNLFYMVAIIFGIIITIYSANLVIDNGISLAKLFGISSAILGILIGFSTSLPELTISLHAIYKGAHGISIGNIIGGNIVDPLLSLGVGAFIAPILIDKVNLWFDLPFLFFSTLVGLMLFRRGGKLTKSGASVMIGLYVVFLVMKFFVV